MAAPGLERHRLALLAAREDVGNPRAGTDWAVFAYEKHHDLKLLDSGAGGPDELARKFCATSVMYGLCRLQDPGTGAHCIVLINWVGEEVPEWQRQTCARHVPTIRNFFRDASVVLSARHTKEVTQEGLQRALEQMAPVPTAHARRRETPPQDTQELVGTNYRKTNPALEIQRTKRDNFWAQAEREEEQRRAEERQRAQEQQRLWERERRQRELREAQERERRLQDTERRIEEQRKEQARLEAEERRKEKERWEQQLREQEEQQDRCSQSLGKAAEAAALVSQRSQNPRDFFRQRERSGSTSGPSTATLGASPGARRPFLRYQRSLTESAFIFRRPDPPTTTPQPGTWRPQPPVPTSPPGTGTSQCVPLGTRPMGTGTSPSAPLETLPSPVGTGTPPSGPLGTTLGTGTPPSGPLGTTLGTGTPPSSLLGTTLSPIKTGTPPSALTSPTAGGTTPSTTGTNPPPCASLGPPLSPATAGSPPGTTPIGIGDIPSPMGTGTPHHAPLEAPPSPVKAETLPATTPSGTGTPPSFCGTPQCATLGTSIGMEVPPCAPHSPMEGRTPPTTSPIGAKPSPCATPVTPPSLTGNPEKATMETLMRMGTPPSDPPSPVWGGSPLATSPTGTLPTPAGTVTHHFATLGTPLSPTGPGAGSPSLLDSVPASAGCAPTSGSLDSTCGAEPLSPPSPSQGEDGPPLDTAPFPSPPAWESPGHNGIGEHGGDPWEKNPTPGQGEEPDERILRAQHPHKAEPGFALLLTRTGPPGPLPRSASPHVEDHEPPHTM